MDRSVAKQIIANAVETTRPRWTELRDSWSNIETIFMLRGYDQQGFQMSRMRPVLEANDMFSVARLGAVMGEYSPSNRYDRRIAGSLMADFYAGLRAGHGGPEGQLFEECVETYLLAKVDEPERTPWKLLWHLLQACAFLKSQYEGSFAHFMLARFARFAKTPEVSAEEFLAMPTARWELFLSRTKPWNLLPGIGENAFDFIFGDLEEAQFAVDWFKLDSATLRFFKATGIGELIEPRKRDTAVQLLQELELPYTLREINRGLYLYCSDSEKDRYGFCRQLARCSSCNVFKICEKNIEKPQHMLGASTLGRD